MIRVVVALNLLYFVVLVLVQLAIVVVPASGSPDVCGNGTLVADRRLEEALIVIAILTGVVVAANNRTLK